MDLQPENLGPKRLRAYGAVMKAAAESPFLPKLRFPEFVDDGAWDVRPLRELCDRLSETAGDSLSTVVRISPENGLMPQAEKFCRDMSDSRHRKHIRLRRGDFAYDRLSTNRFPQGRVHRLTEFDVAAVSNAYYCFRLHEQYEPAFALGFFESNGHGRQLLQSFASGPQSIGRQNIGAHRFFEIATPIPPTAAERGKIADCLGSLDDLIAAEVRKLDILKQRQQGLKLQLFPKEDSPRPTIRFPQYRDSAEWKAVRLGDIADYEKGNAHEKKDIGDDGRFIVANARFISSDGAVAQHANEPDCIAQVGDLLMVTTDTLGAKALARCFLVDADETYVVGQGVTWLRPRLVDGGFLLYALDRHPKLTGPGQGNMMKHLSMRAVLDCLVAVPQDRGEQKCIADCLESLKSLVATQEAKLAALALHKHGLLQQLYPSYGEL